MNPLEAIYAFGLSLDQRRSLKNRKKLPHKVISIGNITVGGTGKTPAAIAVADAALEKGYTPCILTRGYKGQAKGPCFVSTGKGPLIDEKGAGDEAVLMAEKLNGVAVVKGSDRYEAGMFAAERLAPAEKGRELLFILDDGFQHRRLVRDKDILLLDGASPFSNGRLLPLGGLREPVSAMARADIIVITKIPEGRRASCSGLIEEIRKFNGNAPVFFADHRETGFVTPNGGSFPMEWGKGKRSFAFCGLGNPGSFRQSLLAAGIEIAGFKSFRDHHRYGKADIESIVASAAETRADWIVTTEKDIIRLRGGLMPENLVAMAIEFNIEQEFYRKVFDL